MRKRCIDWLANGEIGASSRALFWHLNGYRLEDGYKRLAYPSDADDFRRCHIMLEQTGLLARLEQAATLTPVWKRLVKAWPEIVALFDQEDPTWRVRWTRGAPRTHARIKKALGPRR